MGIKGNKYLPEPTLGIPCKSLRFTSRGVLLGILGGGVPPGSPNPDPISNQIMSFPIPVFRSDL